MTLNVDDRELSLVLGLSAEQRYDYFVRKAADGGEVWGVGDSAGWSLVADESDNECLPVWPADRFAWLMCTEDWESRSPKVIPLEEWLGRWLPGMAADGRLVEVFCTPGDDGVIVLPDRLAEDLQRVLGDG